MALQIQMILSLNNKKQASKQTYRHGHTHRVVNDFKQLHIGHALLFYTLGPFNEKAVALKRKDDDEDDVCLTIDDDDEKPFGPKANRN